jgi:predicted nucleotidyltransferase component of viral defense system
MNVSNTGPVTGCNGLLLRGMSPGLIFYGTHFFLTGGTALSCAYYRHRYSDDLDFFVSSDSTFIEQVNLVLSAILS